jgi:hypothetical protein
MRATSVAAVFLTAALGAVALSAQIGGVPAGGRGRAGGAAAAPSNLPSAPTAVSLPTLSHEVTGPGPMFDSTPSLAPGKGLVAFGYETHEYLISGTANGEPYTTRLVVRRPGDMSKFSGLVLTEAMHGSGSAHMFEFTSIYLMSSGHVAVEVLTTPPAQFVALNEPRYRALKLNGTQTQRDPGAGGRAGARGRAARGACPQDGDGRHVDDGRRHHQLHPGERRVSHAENAAHLRRVPTDVQRFAHRRHGRTNRPRADDARGQRQHHEPPGRRRAGQAVSAV